MKICNPEGRDCIDNKSTSTFNCSVACEGIYADVQWVDNVVEAMEEEPVEDEVEKKLRSMFADASTKFVYENLKKEIEMIKGGKKGDELDRQKLKMLISEYKQSKKNQVQNFRFDSAARSTSFGKLFAKMSNGDRIQNRGILRRGTPTINSSAGADLL